MAAGAKGASATGAKGSRVPAPLVPKVPEGASAACLPLVVVLPAATGVTCARAQGACPLVPQGITKNQEITKKIIYIYIYIYVYMYLYTCAYYTTIYIYTHTYIYIYIYIYIKKYTYIYIYIYIYVNKYIYIYIQDHLKSYWPKHQQIFVTTKKQLKLKTELKKLKPITKRFCLMINNYKNENKQKTKQRNNNKSQN